jgi:hypothetical protein
MQESNIYVFTLLPFLSFKRFSYVRENHSFVIATASFTAETSYHYTPSLRGA